MYTYRVALPPPGEEALEELGKALRRGALPDDLAGYLGAIPRQSH